MLMMRTDTFETNIATIGGEDLKFGPSHWREHGMPKDPGLCQNWASEKCWARGLAGRMLATFVFGGPQRRRDLVGIRLSAGSGTE